MLNFESLKYWHNKIYIIMAWQCKIEHIHPINSSINKQRQHNDRKSFYKNLFVVLFNDSGGGEIRNYYFYRFFAFMERITEDNRNYDPQTKLAEQQKGKN